MQSLNPVMRQSRVEGSLSPSRQALQGPQQRVTHHSSHSSVSVAATATTTCYPQSQKHGYADHDTQHLQPEAAGIFQQLRHVSATLAASVQQLQQQQKPQPPRQQQQYLRKQPRRQQPRRKLFAYDAAAALLTKQLKLATSWQELQHLAQQYQPNGPSLERQQQQQQGLTALNPQLLSCLLSSLVKCQLPAAAPLHSKASAAAVSHDTQMFSTFVGQVFSQVLLLLPAMQPRELSNILWSAAKLNQPPDNHKIRQILTQMTQSGVLAHANAQDVSMCMYAIASLGIQVAEQQIELLLAAAAAQPDSTSPQALANTLWAVAVLQYRPSEQWLSNLESSCMQLLQQQQQRQTAALRSVRGPCLRRQQQQKTKEFSSKGLHQVLWAMAKLEWVPSDAFLKAYWAVSQQQLATMTPQGTTGIMWAAASLEIKPPSDWLDTWFNSSQLQFRKGRCRDLDLANALWASVRLGLEPCASWLQQGLASAEAVLAQAGAQELSVMLWGFAKLGVRPPGPWMGLWLESMHRRMNSYCAPSLACCAYTLALIRYKPSQSWCERLVAEIQRQMAAFGAQELSNIVWAFATLGLRPHKAWFRDFQCQALNESSSFNAQELSILCWSLAKLQYTPPADWVAALLREGLEVQSDMRGQSVVLLMWALARWRLPEIRENGKYRALLPRYWAAAHQLLPSCSLWQLSVLWWARVQLGGMPIKAWSTSFWSVLIPRLLSAVTAAAAAAETAEAGGSLIEDVTPGSASPATFQDQQQQTQHRRAVTLDPGFNTSTIVRLVSATGKMTGLVPPAAQHVLREAAAQCVMSCSMEVLTALGMGLVRMHLQAADAAAPGVAALGRKQHISSVSVGGVSPRGRTGSWRQSSKRSVVQLQPQYGTLWAKWFSRSTQLLQQDIQNAQRQPVTVGQQLQQQQQQLQVAEAVNTVDVSLQLYIAGQMSLSVQPPSSWVTAVLPTVIVQLEAMSLEQLSWVLWSVIKLRVEHKLPIGWSSQILQRCRVLLQGDNTLRSVDAGTVLRLHRSAKQLEKFGVLCEGECELWRVVQAMEQLVQ